MKDMSEVGIDQFGSWSPLQYIIDAGWDAYSVSETARIGVADEDAQDLTITQCDALVAFCKARTN